MVMCRTQHRGPFLTRAPIASVVGLMLLSAPVMKVSGQTGAAPRDSTAWQAWAFGRLGGASGAPGAVATSGGGVLTSAGGGVAASYGTLVGMLRATDSEQLFVGPGVRDNALLVGVRSRADHLFVACAVGIDRATAFQTTDGSGTITGSPQTAFAYDISAHADFRVVGIALAISGVVGPQRTSYVAVTLGPEFGWFGR
jgi:hypothetical protein